VVVVMSVSSLDHDMGVAIVIQGGAHNHSADKTAKSGPDFIVSCLCCLRSQAKTAESGDH
jgi:hypothetical protein